MKLDDALGTVIYGVFIVAPLLYLIYLYFDMKREERDFYEKFEINPKDWELHCAELHLKFCNLEDELRTVKHAYSVQENRKKITEARANHREGACCEHDKVPAEDVYLCSACEWVSVSKSKKTDEESRMKHVKELEKEGWSIMPLTGVTCPSCTQLGLKGD